MNDNIYQDRLCPKKLQHLKNKELVALIKKAGYRDKRNFTNNKETEEIYYMLLEFKLYCDIIRKKTTKQQRENILITYNVDEETKEEPIV